LRTIPAIFPCGPSRGRISLEGEWLLPDEEGPFPGVIVCHPHPLHGGDMLNNVVGAICRALSENGMAAFRFNFRGVGNSEGSYGEGIAEQEDVRAALDFVLASPDISSEKVGLAGYSFGAMVSFKVALRDKRIGSLTLVSAPLPDDDWQQLQEYSNPKFYLVGNADHLMTQERFKQLIRDISDPEQYKVVQGADHFWSGHEETLARKVAEFFAESFGLA